MMNNVQIKVGEFASQPRPRKTKLVLGTTETGPIGQKHRLKNQMIYCTSYQYVVPRTSLALAVRQCTRILYFSQIERTRLRFRNFRFLACNWNLAGIYLFKVLSLNIPCASSTWSVCECDSCAMQDQAHVCVNRTEVTHPVIPRN